jgi:CheY-specific phosphatase CheX
VIQPNLTQSQYNFWDKDSRASACSIAANFLGLDAEELSQTQINEVIGELTNMIAGSLVSHLESDCCFVLSHPEMESPDVFIKKLQAAGSRLFQLEDGLFAVWLQIN